MRTETQIRYDFNKAMRKAEELDHIAAILRQTAKGKMDETLDMIPYMWKGEASDEYRRKGYYLLEKIIRNAIELERTADTVRQIARRTYDAEMMALRIARTRLI